jgi:hypothetical protein
VIDEKSYEIAMAIEKQLPHLKGKQKAQAVKFLTEMRNQVKERNVEMMKSDIFYFIENFVHIEDRDSVELATLFKLWDGQKKALNDFINHRLNIVLKARQLGLTWLALAYVVHNLLFNNGFQVVALSRTEDESKELVRRILFILRYLPVWLVREDTKENLSFAGMKFDSTTMSVTIIHPGKEASLFKSMPASQDAGRSFTANLVLLDEWAFQQWAREIWASAYPTINRPTGGKVIGLSTAKRMTLFEDIWKKSVAKRNTFNRIFLSWRTDPRRTEEWYEQSKKDLGDLVIKQEYPNTPEEAFEAAEGTAFPEFSYDIHVCQPFDIPNHWQKWRSVDNGYTDPFVWYWFAVNEAGTVFIYREYTRDEKDPKVTYTDQAKRVIELTKEKDVWQTVAGLDAWNKHHRDTSNKSLIDYYRDGGVSGFVKAVTDRKMRKSAFHEYLKPYFDENIQKWTAKLQIFDTCTRLIEYLPQYLVDEKDCEKVAECGFDHTFDSAGYGIIYHHANNSLPVEVPDSFNFEFEKPKPDVMAGGDLDWSYINY